MFLRLNQIVPHINGLGFSGFGRSVFGCGWEVSRCIESIEVSLQFGYPQIPMAPKSHLSLRIVDALLKSLLFF
jgi:hypothetical protein